MAGRFFRSGGLKVNIVVCSSERFVCPDQIMQVDTTLRVVNIGDSMSSCLESELGPDGRPAADMTGLE